MHEEKFLKESEKKASNDWQWRSPLLAFILSVLHPLGMLYTSASLFIIYSIFWTLLWSWEERPLGLGIVLAILFGVIAYKRTRKKNGAIEYWRYGLVGTGKAKLKKEVDELIGPDKINFFQFSKLQIISILQNLNKNKVLFLCNFFIPGSGFLFINKKFYIFGFLYFIILAMLYYANISPSLGQFKGTILMLRLLVFIASFQHINLLINNNPKHTSILAV